MLLNCVEFGIRKYKNNSDYENMGNFEGYLKFKINQVILVTLRCIH